jgi:cytidine deaminase
MSDVLQTIDLCEVPADLLAAAREAASHAYAPYSNFPVGAALRTSGGEVFRGANVENASYGLGRCAEQSCVQAMASAGGREISEVVVVSESDPPATPCGACRQVLSEFGRQATLYLVNQQRAQRTTVAALLPAAFLLDR